MLFIFTHYIDFIERVFYHINNNENEYFMRSSNIEACGNRIAFFVSKLQVKCYYNVPDALEKNFNLG